MLTKELDRIMSDSEAYRRLDARLRAWQMDPRTPVELQCRIGWIRQGKSHETTGAPYDKPWVEDYD